jgi:hypothetical protein
MKPRSVFEVKFKSFNFMLACLSNFFKFFIKIIDELLISGMESFCFFVITNSNAHSPPLLFVKPPREHLNNWLKGCISVLLIKVPDFAFNSQDENSLIIWTTLDPLCRFALDGQLISIQAYCATQPILLVNQLIHFNDALSYGRKLLSVAVVSFGSKIHG